MRRWGWMIVFTVGCRSSGDDLTRTACETEEKTYTIDERELLWIQGGAQRGPLWILMHGYGGRPQTMASSTRVRDEARRRGVHVVLPAGLKAPGDNRRSWNAGDCCSFGAMDRDDEAALLRLRDRLADLDCVDSERIFLGGFSNGGLMSYRLACAAADRFAGVAVVGATMGFDPATCSPSRPLPVSHIHGQQDTVIPLVGGKGPFVDDIVPVADALQPFVVAAGCASLETCPSVQVDVRANLAHRWPADATAVSLDRMGLE
ncbi:MAG: PHB depolymerase family esterase [Myxococcota bacterium]